MRTSSLIRALAGISLAAPAKPSLPAVVNVGIVFPRNETYNNATLFPVLLAVDNAEAAFWLGPTISWSISQQSELTGNWGIAALGTKAFRGDEDPPADSTGNNWVVGTRVTNQTVLRPGSYRLEWKWNMLTCRAGPGSRTTYVHGGTQALGEMYFTIVGGGSGGDVNFTAGCPEYSATLIVEETIGGECPVMAGREEREEYNNTDMCGARLDQTMADCLMANITDSSDRSSCEMLLEQAQGNGGGVVLSSRSTASIAGLSVLTWGLAWFLN